MTSHVNTELLSAYLDEELTDRENEKVEEHLEACEACTARLDGMRKVVSHMRHFERMAPPSTLDQMVARRIALAGEPRSLLDRLEDQLTIFQGQSYTFMMFCVIIALSVITFMFAHTLQEQRNIPVVFEDGSPAFVQKESAEDFSVEPVESVEMAGRTLERRDAGWAERGIDEGLRDTVLSLDWDTRAMADLLVEHPELEELRQLEGPVMINLGDRVLLLR